MELAGRDGLQRIPLRIDRLVCQAAMLVLQVPPAIPVELVGRGQLCLLDGDQLAALGYGFDVPEAVFLISMAEVVPQGGALVECSVVRHDLCRDALQVSHEAIVPASAYGSTAGTGGL
jgi:hypothetical protein